jgi:penicillin-binding protein 2
MLERRLRILLIGFGFAGVALVARLVQLQVVHGEQYRAAAERTLVVAPNPTPFVRGRILDRSGEVLVADRACWDLKIDFAAIAAEQAGRDDALRAMIRRLKRERRYPDLHTKDELAAAFRADCRAMWGDLAWFNVASTAGPVQDFREPARQIYEKVLRIRRSVAKRRGFDAPVAEESMAHPLICGLSHEQQIRAREIFEGYSWIRIEPSSSREFAGDTEPMAHILGRVAKVDADVLEDDPNWDNPFARYQADDIVGTSGAEWLAESILRGRRGQIVRDREGAIVEEIEAEDGGDVRLTVHAGLQRRLYLLLEEAVLAHPSSSGGSIVVLDVPTREVLALVSYPSYDPNAFAESYAELRDDTERMPLLFRAVASRYAPGSTIKPLTCLAGLINGVIAPGTRETCTGYLFENQLDAWRCWEVHGTGVRKAHGDINVVEALTGSCNIFMYRLGEKLGGDRLCAAFDMAGVGRSTGVGLREENVGINPTPSWLRTQLQRTVTPGMPRLYAMGQGEIAMTPLQVANLFATYASGKWRPARLVRDAKPSPQWTLPGEREAWEAIRRGIYGVTNDPDGTAYKYAHFERDGCVLSGKTGSATATPWPTAYRIPYRDENGTRRLAVIREGARGPALARFAIEYSTAMPESDGVEVDSRWPNEPPADGEHHAHAWFGGYLQPTTPDGRPDFAREPRIAFAVLVEFGGSGGQTSGPLAKEVAAELLAMLGPELNPDAAPRVPAPGWEVAGR